jgi:hypothetical protein
MDLCGIGPVATTPCAFAEVLMGGGKSWREKYWRRAIGSERPTWGRTKGAVSRGLLVLLLDMADRAPVKAGAKNGSNEK